MPSPADASLTREGLDDLFFGQLTAPDTLGEAAAGRARDGGPHSLACSGPCPAFHAWKDTAWNETVASRVSHISMHMVEEE
jgi:hypothetical protein